MQPNFYTAGFIYPTETNFTLVPLLIADTTIFKVHYTIILLSFSFIFILLYYCDNTILSSESEGSKSISLCVLDFLVSGIIHFFGVIFLHSFSFD